jgi:flagellar export protein FliJ
MGRFRFRPQAALDLRRREHDVAQRELARADAERQRLAALVDSAAHAVARAQAESDGAADQAQREWYRFWIVRLEHELAARREALGAQDAVVAARRTACLEARKRQEALERLRNRAQAAHSAAEAERERKMVDEVAAQRFARRDLTEGV